jgi:hypothetical protein
MDDAHPSELSGAAWVEHRATKFRTVAQKILDRVIYGNKGAYRIIAMAVRYIFKVLAITDYCRFLNCRRLQVIVELKIITRVWGC